MKNRLRELGKDFDRIRLHSYAEVQEARQDERYKTAKEIFADMKKRFKTIDTLYERDVEKIEKEWNEKLRTKERKKK